MPSSFRRESLNLNRSPKNLFVHGQSFPVDRSRLRIDRRPNNGLQSTTSIRQAASQIKTTPKPMTAPISVALPSEKDNLMSMELESELATQDPQPTTEEESLRVYILKNIEDLSDKWAASQSIQMGWSPEDAAKVKVSLRIFGSNRLGVNGRNADIDATAIFPRHISRQVFFTEFPEVLRKWSEVEDLNPIAEAYVPIIKMRICGIDVDLLFARLGCKLLPPDLDLSDDTLLHNMSEECVRSVNGCRVAEAINSTVCNVKEYRVALRAVKLWAKRQGVYGNTLGYLGGITWAILMARVAQLYPNATASTLVRKFFTVWTLWEWPRPVLLNPIQNVFSGKVWDPRVNEAERYHLMPVITPVYPAQNTTFNVSLATLPVIKAALSRGLEMVKSIDAGDATWSDFFTPYPFFSIFKHFVALEASASSPADLASWGGFVESRIRHLIRTLMEHGSAASVTICPAPVTSKLSKTWWIGLTFAKPAEGQFQVTADLSAEFLNFKIKVLEDGASFWRDGMDVKEMYVRKKDLKSHIPLNLLQKGRKRCRQFSSGSIGAPTPKRLKGSQTPLSSTSSCHSR